MKFRLGYCLLLLLTLVAAPAHAGDGRVEINQTKALAGGVTPGDAPGFPVTIDTPGSYVLTGNLQTATPTQTGIEIATDDVTIDLNGFTIQGLTTCVFGNCTAGEGSGISRANIGQSKRVTVHSGTVRGFGNWCIKLEDRAHVHHVLAEECGFAGIELGGASLLDHNRVYNVGRWGLNLQAWTPFSYNTIASVGLNGPGGTFQGGDDAGGNRCTDLSCKPIPVPKRHYYLTNATKLGNQVSFSCAATYHTASISELADPSNLVYDPTFAQTTDDRGEGAPHGVHGWIRTGNNDEVSGATTGMNNCNHWTSQAAGHMGTTAELGTNWTSVPPWSFDSRPCAVAQPVWCIEN